MELRGLIARTGRPGIGEIPSTATFSRSALAGSAGSAGLLADLEASQGSEDFGDGVQLEDRLSGITCRHVHGLLRGE